MKIKCTKSSVQRGADHHLIRGAEGNTRDGRGVLSEGNEAEPCGGVPKLHLGGREGEREGGIKIR